MKKILIIICILVILSLVTIKVIDSYKNYVAEKTKIEAVLLAEQKMSELTEEVYNKIIHLEFESALDVAYKIYNEDPKYPGRSLLISQIYFSQGIYDKSLKFIEQEIQNKNIETISHVLLTWRTKVLFYNGLINEFKQSLTDIPDYIETLKTNVDKSGFLISRCELKIYNNDWDEAKIDLINAKENMYKSYWMHFYTFVIETYYQEYENCFTFVKYLNSPDNKSNYNLFASRKILKKILLNTRFNDKQKIFYYLILHHMGSRIQSKYIDNFSPLVINDVINEYGSYLNKSQIIYLKSLIR